jgi:hypothetical protein
MSKQQFSQQGQRDGYPYKNFPRRTLLALFGGAILPVLGGCKEEPPGLPKPPYGRALDITQANTFVEFDVRVEVDRKNPLSRYDVVLEVFEKTPLEKGPLPDDSKAHFKVSIRSFEGLGELIAEREVIGNKGPNGMQRGSFGPSSSEKTELMSRRGRLIERLPLNPGQYRIRCESLNALPALEGRLVKVTLETIHYPK